MSYNDPIADLLTRIRNGIMAKKRYVDIPWSRQKETIIEILEEKGFVEQFLKKVKDTQGVLRVFLKYKHGKTSAITGLKRMSRPGRRKYIKTSEIPYFYSGFGVPVLSTSSGVIAGDLAKEKNVGGELLFLVW